MCQGWMSVLLLCVLSLRAEVNLQEVRTQHANRHTKEAFTFYLDAQGDTVRDGKYESWFEDGRPHEHGWYHHGKRDSLWTEWDASGLKCYEITWLGGRMHGPYVKCNGDTGAFEKGKYVNGKRDGFWMVDGHALTGNAQHGWGHYGRGLKQGRWVEYWQMRTGLEMCCVTGNYLNDKREGDWQFLCTYSVYKDDWCMVWRYAADKRVKTLPCSAEPRDTCGCSAFFDGKEPLGDSW